MSTSGRPRTLPNRAQRILRRHHERLQGILQRPLDPPLGPEVPPERHAHLLQQAEELYWNELAWEQITGEEAVGRRLVEYMFPGFLAFVDGLLLRETNRDSPAPATPRPAVVQAILVFLAERTAQLEDAGEEDRRMERLITERLIDLVLYRLYSVRVEGLDPLPDDA